MLTAAMKYKLLIASALLAMPAFAGSPSSAPTSMPATQPSLWNWFVGGSAGYLIDAEEWMFTGQIGVDTPWNVGGWNVALFGELGYTEVEDAYSITSVSPARRVEVETDVMPLTFNFKLERPLTGNLNAYMGGGLGVSFISVDSTSTFGAANYSDDETVFTGQIFAGLVYNVSEAFEIFGGARWIYTDSATIKGRDVDFDEDVMFELGARFNF
jgi:opacity protein-like surface antigen